MTERYRYTKKSQVQPVGYDWLDAEIADEFVNEFGVELDQNEPRHSDFSQDDELTRGLVGNNFGKTTNNW